MEIAVEKNILYKQVGITRLLALTAMLILAFGFLAKTCRAEVSQSSASQNPASQKVVSQDFTSMMALQAAATQELDQDCGLMLENVKKRSLDKDRIVTVQQQLLLLEYSPEWVDGILGPKTQQALTQFCDRARFARSADLLIMLQNHVAIFKLYPHWTQTLASGGFEKWEEGEDDKDEIGLVRLFGNSTEVIALLDRYRKRKLPPPVAQPVDNLQVSYMLTQENFSQLKARGEVLKRFEKLQGKTYPGSQEFEAAVEAALQGVPNAEKQVQLALKYAELQTCRKFTDDSFNKLKIAAVPAYILQSVQELKGVNFPLDKIDGAVQTALGSFADKVINFDPGEIVVQAEISKSGTATITDVSIKKFTDAHPGDPAAAAIIAKLQKLKKIEYQSAKTMTAAMKNVLKQAGDDINGFQSTILSSAVETVAYGLTEKSIQDMSGQIGETAVPQIYLELIGELLDVQYPNADLFWLAAKAKVSMAGSYNIPRATLFGALANQDSDKIDEAFLEKLSGKVPPALIAQIGTLQGRTFSDGQALKNEVENLLDKLEDDFEQYRPLLVSLARKTHPFDASKIIQWSGESCNCVHENLSGQVYGFYPYWLAGQKQDIDFSVQTRIGFYALGFDDKGNIEDASRWSGQDTGFINEARKYGSKVDLVIHKNDWDRWSQASAPEKKESFEKLAAGIVNLLGIPLTSFSSKLTHIASLGISHSPVMGDGVTLYFEDYPRDPESVAAFIEFIRNLGKMLQSTGRHSSINVMFRSAEIGMGIYDYAKLLDIIDSVKDNKLDVLFPVLLQEPTTDNKKLLRLNIESGLHGEKRMKLLRNVATVITFDGHGEKQLNDDVIYAKDNFGGVGFWPQAMVSASSVSGAMVANALHENYMNFEKKDAPGVCKYICPHKLAYRIVFGIFVFALLLSVAMRFIVCEWKVFFDDHFIYFIAGIVVPTFLLGLALLFCDPGWDEFSKGNAPLIFVIAGIIGYSIWNYQDKKNNADLP